MPASQFSKSSVCLFSFWWSYIFMKCYDFLCFKIFFIWKLKHCMLKFLSSFAIFDFYLILKKPVQSLFFLNSWSGTFSFWADKNLATDSWPVILTRFCFLLFCSLIRQPQIQIVSFWLLQFHLCHFSTSEEMSGKLLF